MPTITIRLSEDEKCKLGVRAHQAGLSLSDYAREALKLREDQPDLAETIRTLVERSNNAIVVGTLVDQHERRLKQLEQIAGLD